MLQVKLKCCFTLVHWFGNYLLKNPKSVAVTKCCEPLDSPFVPLMKILNDNLNKNSVYQESTDASQITVLI